MTTRVFFICAYGAFVAFAIHMAIEPQKEAPEESIDVYQLGTMTNVDCEDYDVDANIRKVGVI